MTILWLRIWWYARRKAIAAIAEEYPGEVEAARFALALHDAADSLLGEQA